MLSDGLSRYEGLRVVERTRFAMNLEQRAGAPASAFQVVLARVAEEREQTSGAAAGYTPRTHQLQDQARRAMDQIPGKPGLG